jgi:hypothetical protein
MSTTAPTPTVPVDSVFHKAKTLVETRYKQMIESGRLLLQVEVDKDELWKAYHDGFTDPEIKLEHQCSACRNFIKAIGGLVTFNAELEMTTLWDFRGQSDIPEVYLASFDALDRYVRSRPIEGLFSHVEPSAGVNQNLDKDRSVIWQHYFAKLPAIAFNKDNVVGRKSAELRDSKNVLVRSITEISEDAVQTVRELIAQDSLPRGREYSAIIEQLWASQIAYKDVREEDRDAWAWLKAHDVGPALARARNTAVGALLQDLTAGRDLEGAVAAYDRIMAPTSFKRPTALVTPRMLETAKARLQELDLMSALDRRRLDTRDLTVANALYVYRPTTSGKDVFAQIADETPVQAKTLEKVERIGIDDFVANVLPTAKRIRVLVEREHMGHFVTLTGAVDPEAKNMMKHDNSFSFSYAGGVADAIKERVKREGGNVNGWMRASLAWHNYDDLDLHFQGGGEHVYFSNKRGRLAWLDVDMNAGGGSTREPVENITCDKQLPAGSYEVWVNQYNRREERDSGFELEIEANGSTFNFGSPTSPRVDSERIKFTVDKDGNVNIGETAMSKSHSGMVKWGVKTGTFVQVKAITLSPNHWTKPVGLKHWFFLLDGCVSDEQTRPFFNEHLCAELAKDRKVTEVLASKIQVAPAEGAELSGLGFSESNRNHIYVEVEGQFKRTLKVLF